MVAYLLKEERKVSTYSMWAQVCYICESCVQYVPAMGSAVELVTLMNY